PSAKGTGSLQQAQASADFLANDYPDLAADVSAATQEQESYWSGSAAGAAQRGTAPIAEDMQANANEMNTGQDLTRRQADSWNRTKHTVVQPASDGPAQPKIPGQPGMTAWEQSNQTSAAGQINSSAMDSFHSDGAYNSNLPSGESSLPAPPSGFQVSGGGKSTPPGPGYSGGPHVSGPGPGGGGPGPGSGGPGPGGEYKPPPTPGRGGPGPSGPGVS
ncbi:MAG: hypothetical protein J2P17_31385, partial [Mycobacterium sp.]|nr:hypothetical protein [Mycobacterium sp.]